MKSLWIFGDSFSSPFSEVCPNYIIFKGYIPKIYPDFISDKLHLNLKNIAVSSSSNYTIFNSFIKNMKKIEKDDIVIFGWSDIVRFRIVTEENKWVNVLPADVLPSWSNFSKKAVQETLVNRSHDLYLDELNNYIELINVVLKENKVIHWSWVDYRGKLNLDFPFIVPVNILTETNNLIDDGHYTEDTHKKIADIFIKHLNYE